MLITSEVTVTTKRYKEKREALLSAASNLINEKGVIGTTLSEVGATVGLIKNSLTYYFRRKEDLAEACFERAIDIYDGLIADASNQSTIRSRVTELIRAYVGLHAAISQGVHSPVVMFHEIRALPEPQRSNVLARYTSMYRRMREILNTSETSEWPREHLNARTFLLISYLNGIRPLVAGYEPEDYPRLVKTFSDIALNGINSSQSQWAPIGLELEWLTQLKDLGSSSQFLRAATELINEQGYAGASVNRIAEKLNLTKGGFYYYINNRDDLIAQCFERSIDTIRKAVTVTESYQDTEWDRLCSIVRGLVRFQLSAEGPLLRSTANSALPEPDHRARANQALGRINERISGVILSALSAGSVRAVDSSLAARTILIGVIAAAELRRWVKSADEENSGNLYARPILQGLLCPIN
jgi:AcrR family transcriptional regulator